MWVATINSVKDEVILTGQKRVVVNVTYSNNGNGNPITKDLFFTSGTKDIVYQQIQADLDNLNSIATIATDVVLGPFTPLVAATKSSAQIARQAYADNVAMYRHWKAAIDAGVVTALNTTYTTLISTLNSTFDPSYIDLF